MKRNLNTRRDEARLAALTIAVISAAGIAGGCEGARDLDAELTPGAETTAARARVVGTIDGDTVIVRRRGAIETVRLVGIDAPESVHPDRSVECGGDAASGALARKLPEGARVRLLRDPNRAPSDRYGRSLRYLERGKGDIGEAMVRAGNAAPYAYRGRPYGRQESYEVAAEEAQRAGDGVWGRCGGDFHLPEEG
ncbi:MAG: thermonuclease family protein [Solirubrobacterales bacterium]